MKKITRRNGNKVWMNRGKFDNDNNLIIEKKEDNNKRRNRPNK